MNWSLSGTLKPWAIFINTVHSPVTDSRLGALSGTPQFIRVGSGNVGGFTKEAGEVGMWGRCSDGKSRPADGGQFGVICHMVVYVIFSYMSVWYHRLDWDLFMLIHSYYGWDCCLVISCSKRLLNVFVQIVIYIENAHSVSVGGVFFFCFDTSKGWRCGDGAMFRAPQLANGAAGGFKPKTLTTTAPHLN